MMKTIKSAAVEVAEAFKIVKQKVKEAIVTNHQLN